VNMTFRIFWDSI